MSRAYNYRDFIRLLTEKVCTEETTDLAIFFATLHATELYDYECLERIAKKHGNLLIIRPNLFFASAAQSENVDWNKGREAADLVLVSKPEKWLVGEMYLAKLEFDMMDPPRSDDTIVDTLVEFIDNNPELNFYESRLYELLAMRANRMGDQDAANKYTERAISNAELHNEVSRLAYLLRTKANLLSSSDRKQALQNYLRARELMESMGDERGLSNVLYNMSKLDTIRGEYNQAVQKVLEVIRIKESLGVPIGLNALTLSMIYNTIGDCDAGLEWAKLAEVESQNQPSILPRVFLRQAWSLIIQNRLAEAQWIMDTTNKTILKGGVEDLLAGLYFVNGAFEVAEGNYTLALKSYGDALEIYERIGAGISVNLCLQQLASLDLILAEISHPDASGVWVGQFEERARLEDLPGILGQALILKSKLFMLQERHQESREALAEVDTLVQDYNLEYLSHSLNMLL
jgi:tetratricopeptide (TPR) repeat protein